MVLLQPRLHLKVSQRQILTPGLVQMVSVLALNKLELRDMINAEMVENPVLEELEDAVPLLDDVDRKEEDRDRPAPTPEENPITAVEKKDPFEEIDFGSFFQDYLDPGYRSQSESEEIERPSFENFLSRPSNLTDHLTWQLGSLPTRPPVREAAELVIGNLNEDGYLIATDEELMGVVPPAPPESDAAAAENVVKEAAALGLASAEVALPEDGPPPHEEESFSDESPGSNWNNSLAQTVEPGADAATAFAPALEPVVTPPPAVPEPVQPVFRANFSLADLHEAIELVRQLDPPGVACRDLRECLLYQLRFHQQHLESHKNGNGDREATKQVLADAIAVVNQHLRALTLKQFKEIGRAINRPVEAVQSALEYIRTLDPRPGLRYNKVQPRLIEPDVAFVKHGDEWLVVMNDEDVPQLRLNPAYRRLLTKDANDKDTRNYVKERYKSAIQLIKNIEQRKQTIMKVCYSIVARQQDFLEKGIDCLKPMMIKEVAEEIGVHPSTVSRAVASKYAHTPQGVFELRYFFSESVNGPEGSNTSLLILKRRVKKLIDEEDPTRPLTDEQITRILQSQGIQVTRRTVAKYREDMRIPSTHQRRVKS
ncbi:MAG TPA: RNA polymerase factor sigma-54 [Terriglobales bacterium]|nr:RNA polymerase factor sigma-54 [Terriglobales bacterium]